MRAFARRHVWHRHAWRQTSAGARGDLKLKRQSSTTPRDPCSAGDAGKVAGWIGRPGPGAGSDSESGPGNPERGHQAAATSTMQCGRKRAPHPAIRNSNSKQGQTRRGRQPRRREQGAKREEETERERESTRGRARRAHRTQVAWRKQRVDVSNGAAQQSCAAAELRPESSHRQRRRFM